MNNDYATHKMLVYFLNTFHLVEQFSNPHFELNQKIPRIMNSTMIKK
jgi:hypothetical protein